MRITVVEEVGNGFVVRCREGEDQSAIVFSGDNALQDVLEHIMWYFTIPPQPSSSPSFAALPVVRPGSVPETALEPRRRRTPLPTESQLPQTQHDVKTIRMPMVEDDLPTRHDDPFGA